MNKITIATTNAGKAKEIGVLLQDLTGFVVDDLSKYAIEEPPEPYESFMANASHKAKYYAEHVQGIVLAEDSGFCIEALGGFPGVRSKEFIGECGGVEAAFTTLAQRLKGINNHKATMHCACVLYLPDEDLLLQNEGTVEGKITFPPKGDGGFAYDPIFIPNGYDKTFAELGTDKKSQMSHRLIAVDATIKELVAYLKNERRYGAQRGL